MKARAVAHRINQRTPVPRKVARQQLGAATAVAVGQAPVVDVAYAKPFLKWAGGKTQLLAELRKHFPPAFQRYHEPFLGGGAVFFHTRPDAAVLSDVNVDLIATYVSIRDHVEELIEALREHEVSEPYYYAVRAQDSSSLTPIECAARTIFLNRTCFNGLYRVNRSGQFNVPYGRYDNPTICNAANLRLVHRALQGVDIAAQSVFDISRRVRRNDLVYFDPPYDPVSSSASFTAYARGGFGRDEQVQLRDLFARLANRGVHVVLSNSDTPFIRDIYRDFRINRVHARRTINSRADRRGTVHEVIVTP